jgi:hypothetical protein
VLSERRLTDYLVKYFPHALTRSRGGHLFPKYLRGMVVALEKRQGP